MAFGDSLSLVSGGSVSVSNKPLGGKEPRWDNGHLILYTVGGQQGPAPTPEPDQNGPQAESIGRRCYPLRANVLLSDPNLHQCADASSPLT
jgi:hypothetical protein